MAMKHERNDRMTRRNRSAWIGPSRRVALAVMAILGLGFFFSGCAATGGGAGALLGYGITGNARGAAMGAGAGMLAGGLYDAGVLRPNYPPPYYSSPPPPSPGYWVWVPGRWDYYGRWMPGHREWVPY
jgi:hypothetical protein